MSIYFNSNSYYPQIKGDNLSPLVVDPILSKTPEKFLSKTPEKVTDAVNKHLATKENQQPVRKFRAPMPMPLPRSAPMGTPKQSVPPSIRETIVHHHYPTADQARYFPHWDPYQRNPSHSIVFSKPSTTEKPQSAGDHELQFHMSLPAAPQIIVTSPISGSRTRPRPPRKKVDLSELDSGITSFKPMVPSRSEEVKVSLFQPTAFVQPTQVPFIEEQEKTSAVVSRRMFSVSMDLPVEDASKKLEPEKAPEPQAKVRQNRGYNLPVRNNQCPAPAPRDSSVMRTRGSAADDAKKLS